MSEKTKEYNQTIAENIRMQMKIHGKSRRTICNDLNIPYTTFTDWVNAVTYPRIDKIEMLANYFGVSKSQLMNKMQTEESSVNRGFGSRLYQAMKDRGINQAELSKRTGISKSSISQYIYGYAEPRPDKTIAICKVLNISYDWLIGYSDKYELGKQSAKEKRYIKSIELTFNDSISIRELETLKHLEEFSVEELELVGKYIDFLTSNRKKQGEKVKNE